MFFCRRIPLRLLLLPVLAIKICTVSAEQMDLISSSDELINSSEDGSPQYKNPSSKTLTPSEADINDVGIAFAPSIMVDESAGAGAGLAENSINAIDNCAKVLKNSRRGVQLRKKRQPPDWCDNKQKPATFSGSSGGDSDGDYGTTISDPAPEAPPQTKPILKPKPGGDSDGGDDTNSAPTREAPPRSSKPILKPKPAGDTPIKDLQQVFLRLGGGSICNTELEYFRYQYPVCFPYAMGGKGQPFAANRRLWKDRFGLTLESGYLRKDIFPCRPSKCRKKKILYFSKKRKNPLLDFPSIFLKWRFLFTLNLVERTSYLAWRQGRAGSFVFFFFFSSWLHNKF